MCSTKIETSSRQPLKNLVKGREGGRETHDCATRVRRGGGICENGSKFMRMRNGSFRASDANKGAKFAGVRSEGGVIVAQGEGRTDEA